MEWSYGVTTVPSRIKKLLPRTLTSLAGAGFTHPRLFIDGAKNGEDYKHFGLEITTRDPAIRVAANWVLALYELYLRKPNADRYAVFQDDFVTYKNLKNYLEQCTYPPKGYWNLNTFPENEAKAPKDKIGWYLSNQRGKSATALAFNNEAVTLLLGRRHLIIRAQQPKRGYQAIDGAVVTSFGSLGWKEFVHNPSLVHHTGDKSTILCPNGTPKTKNYPPSATFRGEDFDALELI